MKSYLLIQAFTFCVALANFALAGIVLTARRYRLENIWMAALATAAGLWGLGVTVFLLTGVGEQDFANFIVRFYYVIAALIPLCLVELSVCFPKNRHWSLPIHVVLAAGFVIITVLSITHGGVIKDVILSEAHGNSVILNPFYYILYVIYFLSYVCIAVAQFTVSYIETKRRRQFQLQKQLRSMIGGMMVALTFGGFFNLIMPLTGDYGLIWAGPPFTILFVVAQFYAIIKQGLFDLRAALARTTAYFLLIIGLTALYGLLIFSITDLFFIGKQITSAYAAVYVAVGLTVTLTYSPLKRLIDRQTHRLFYRDEYNIADITRRLSDITAEEIELRSLVKRSLELLDRTLAPEYIVAYVSDSKGRLHHFTASSPSHVTPHQRKVQLDIIETLLDKMPRVIDTYEMSSLGDAGSQHLIKSGHASMILQFVVQHERVGALFIGDKQSGRPYDDKDIQLLSTATDELALAIQNSLRFGEIQNFNETLKEKVSTATSKLRHTNRELQRLDEAKDEFVSMASHQLRTPLTSIKGYISMVMEGDAGKITDQQKHLLNEAFVSSERMVHLIADFLSVSRLQTGKFIVDAQPIDFDLLIRHEIEVMQPIASSHGQKLEYIRPVAKREIVVDEAKIQQVVMNFIDNAVYYSKPNSTINIGLDYNNREVIFTVKDTGIGVPKDEQGKLFSKFFRAVNARKQRPDGTGVGLFLAKKIVTAHNGSIIFTSKENQGSTFGFRLPLK
jgi:signal transduction histidine kinase